jgi:hypothetical protein
MLMERKHIIRVTTFVQNPVSSRGIQQEKGQNDDTTSGSIRAFFTHQTAQVNGVRFHYVIGDQGFPVVLLHGWPQT